MSTAESLSRARSVALESIDALRDLCIAFPPNEKGHINAAQDIECSITVLARDCQEAISEEVLKIIEIAMGGNWDGFSINMRWPWPIDGQVTEFQFFTAHQAIRWAMKMAHGAIELSKNSSAHPEPVGEAPTARFLGELLRILGECVFLEARIRAEAGLAMSLAATISTSQVGKKGGRSPKHADKYEIIKRENLTTEQIQLRWPNEVRSADNARQIRSRARKS